MGLLQELSAKLAIPGLPDWTGPLALLVLLLVGLAYLLMPFSVFGVKGRLESVEAQLDEIQSELRQLAMRLPEPVGRRATAIQEGWEDPPSHGRAPEPRPLRATPPIPPPPAMPDGRSVRQAPRFR